MKHLKEVFLLIIISLFIPALLLAQQGSMDWTQATDSAAWTERREHSSVVFDDRIWVLGGNASDDSRKNDVWYSSDGANWTCATESAGWSRRRNHAVVAFDNKIWVLGGYNRTNDVWYSTNGSSWTQATASAGWARRDGHAVVAFDNKIWVLGGYATSLGRMNDVWYSSDGINWTCATDTAAWARRDNHTAVVFDNKIWVIGGYANPGGRMHDVWYSSDGINWICATDSAGWSEREVHTAVVYDNKIWVLGGNGSRKNDVWYSSDGANWTQATNSAGWTRRIDHTSVTYDDKIWVLGGYDGHRKNDVWHSKGYIATLISPNGGDTLFGGSNQTIRWRTNLATFTQFRLLFSSDGGLTYSDTIANNLLPSETTYQWTVPFINARQCRVVVQVVDNDSIRVQDASDYNFMVQTLNIISPNGNETLVGGNNQIIRWQTTYSGYALYRLLFTSDTGLTYDTIVSNLTPADTIFNWTVPLINSTLCRVIVQILDSTGLSILQDASDNLFTIRTIQMIIPNGNEIWQGGSNKIIKWRTYMSINFSHYRLLLSSDGGATYPDIIVNNIISTESTYIWTLPNINSNLCRVRVQIINTSDSAIASDASDKNFTIDSDPPSQFSLLLPSNNGWTGRNPTFSWQPAMDNFGMSYYQLSIAIPSETIRTNCYTNYYYAGEGSNWTQATDSAGWSPRANHTSVVFDNKMWVLGGEDEYDIRNDVWYSVDGVNWTQTTSSAGWSPRYNHTSVVFDNKMWVLGGYDYINDSEFNDVWYSTDGVNWILATDSAEWSPRDGHTSIVFDNKMWVIGGFGYEGDINDVWYSFNGINWTQATASAEWSPRDGHTSVVFDNKMWVIGCGNDVWHSNDGVNWVCTTNQAEWGYKYNHTSVVYDNKMWVVGGSGHNDVWYSGNGINWVCATPSASWSGRGYHTSVVYDNKMWVIGGDWLNDVWYSSISLHLPEGTQSWWVTAFDRAGNSRHSNETFIVRIDTTLPTVPSLISPNDSALISDSTATFIWSSASDILSGVLGYRFQVSTNTSFEPTTDTIILDTTFTIHLTDSSYFWRVCAIDSGGNRSSWSNVRTFRIQTVGIEENLSLLSALRLSLKIYPNPAKSQTAIRYSLPSKSKISLVLYDITGRLAKTIINEEKKPGIYMTNFKTNNLSAGIYFVLLQVDNKKSLINRLVIVK
jgi:hypothetical protein